MTTNSPIGCTRFRRRWRSRPDIRRALLVFAAACGARLDDQQRAAANGRVVGAAAGSPGDNGGATDIGVTGDAVRLGNVSTLSGPVPGLFRGAVIGTQAVVAYQNSLGGIHGRRLVLDVRDDQLDSAQNRAATRDLVDKVFAFAGSFAVYDDASAAEVEKSGIPDVTPTLSGACRRADRSVSRVAPRCRCSARTPRGE